MVLIGQALADGRADVSAPAGDQGAFEDGGIHVMGSAGKSELASSTTAARPSINKRSASRTENSYITTLSSPETRLASTRKSEAQSSSRATWAATPRTLARKPALGRCAASSAWPTMRRPP